jgi:hypothetical protein
VVTVVVVPLLATVVPGAAVTVVVVPSVATVVLEVVDVVVMAAEPVAVSPTAGGVMIYVS